MYLLKWVDMAFTKLKGVLICRRMVLREPFLKPSMGIPTRFRGSQLKEVVVYKGRKRRPGWPHGLLGVPPGSSAPL